ncbi:GNAT family N-acetyltransferase [Sphingomonas sp. LT1P40]|uniref:GNAT family N-acetyltransferase n=1 Tax=Alteristakelama amylovorans TaxID=3096166 RepID=UPI002FC7BC96
MTDNRSRSRYELVVDGHTAFAAYTIDGDVMTFTHTIVPPALEGRGIASRLILHALTDVRARGMTLIAKCSFVAAYIRKHPEWADLLAEPLD